ncbi:AAA family ATPase [Brachybacterium sp. DNPG3]
MIDIVLCASGADEVRIVHDIAGEHAAEMRVVRRCADLAETLAVAAAGIGDVILIDLGVRGLGRDPLAALLRDAAVIGLRGTSDTSRTVLGLRHIVEASAPTGDVVAAIRAALEGEAEHDAWTEAPPPAPEGAPGRMVVLWGPVGSPGRSTIAANLAFEAALAGRPTILVDADTVGPSLAQLLGVLDETPGLVAACRAYDRDTLDDDTLHALMPELRPGLRLLSGIGVPARWPELRRSALEGVWQALRRLEALVVVDVSGLLEEDEELSYDTAAPQRHAAAISALEHADAVLAVAGADPLSITRLLRAAPRLEELGVSSPHIVVNRVGAPVSADRVRELILHRMPATSFTALPDDPAACRTALWDGALLAEAAPRSALRRALRDLAAETIARWWPQEAPSPWRGRRRPRARGAEDDGMPAEGHELVPTAG